ncbi:MAG: ketopantoate reductase family protein [Chloroflexi bacterium]|uniref:2-dehydropantoate 2-reductase n=1 Tax=Candidatus Chlorohelix allophototropha TaxID=3003348 RepID=A0A8T7M8W6_9CHLR|nr:ketopantoate reductase family protein [Chloroflexota bacterium]WJW68500.1 ketopantoate reductase family protein [Chloroflexota bacterium L227-S17]
MGQTLAPIAPPPGFKMKVAVIGAGSLGSLVAGLLGLVAGREDEIFLVTNRPMPDTALTLEPAELVRQQLPVFSEGAVTVRNVRVVENPAEAAGCQLAIVLVKSYRTREAGEQAAALLAEDGVVLSLQNGLGNLTALASVPKLAGQGLAQGVTTIGALQVAAGHIRFNGAGHTSLPILDSPAGNRTLAWFGEKLEQVGLSVSFSGEVESLVWGKLAINCAVNALSALLDFTYEAFLANSPALQVASQAGQEVAELAQLKGIALPYPDVESEFRRVVSLNRATISSMCQSIRKGRPTEIEALNGAVVAEAERLGYPVPVNRLLTQLIRALEAKQQFGGSN